jgi:hypothetical protein
MIQIPCDIVQEYEIPSGVTAIRIEAKATVPSRASSSAVTLHIPPGAVLRLRLVCLPEPRRSASPLRPISSSLSHLP